jgi:hypothetical protein
MLALTIVTSMTSIECHVELMRSLCVVMQLAEHAYGIEGRVVSAGALVKATCCEGNRARTPQTRT